MKELIQPLITADFDEIVCFVHTTGKTPNNTGQVLKDLVVAKIFNIWKLVSCKIKNSKPVNINVYWKKTPKKCSQFQLSSRKSTQVIMKLATSTDPKFGISLA